MGFPILRSKAFLGFEEQEAGLRERERERVEVVTSVESDTGLVPYLLVLMRAHRSPGWAALALLYIHARRVTERTPASCGLLEWLEAPAVGIFAF